jgi:glycosyltransferase involved in cell wall biosynthesis
VRRRPELIVLSHLRWVWVWQRPQHLISRLARSHRTWFVEEPILTPDTDGPRVRSERHGPVTRVWFEGPGEPTFLPFDAPEAAAYPELLREHLGGAEARTVWLYTPMAMPHADALERDVLVYDVMDDLASFKGASPELRRRQADLLERADVVFAGGRSLDAGVRDRAPERTFLFPSGVEPEHFARARAKRGRRERPVAGYVGVIDERVDLDLVGELARRLPDWDVEMVGPVTKIDEADLPREPNLRYPGLQPYERLPAVLAGFDVALMPFALNEATRSISPTKTLEYLAAGLPVVSTRVPDVVASYPGVVDLRDDAAGFAAACDEVRRHERDERDAKVRPLLHLHHWDTIAARMRALMDQARAGEPLRDAIPEIPTAAPGRSAGAVA